MGREQELHELGQLLGDNRLLTLTGIGGVGKTRLALAIAAKARLEYLHGVWFVDLAGLSDPGAVVPTIARTLYVTPPARGSFLQALAGYLRDKQILLLLDNFEQVAEAAVTLPNLLGAAPGLTLLVTSRVPLHVAGEQVYTVPPLPTPDGVASPDGNIVQSNPAAQLFIDRARALRADFALTADYAAIAAICTRLDCLPLAIELAAARTPLLPVSALLARLDRRLPLLRGATRGAPPRQQTLRATLEWSWELLTAFEQALFRRLGVFAGGWTVEAAERVCNHDGTIEVLEALASLIDKNLVQQRERSSEPRFTMMATVREFAIEQLAAAGELTAVQERHAAYCGALASGAADAAMRNGRFLDMLGRLDRERDNLLTALQWTVEHGAAALGLQLAGPLLWWFFFRALSDGRRWLERLLTLPGANETGSVRGLALLSLGGCLLGQGEAHAAAHCLEEAAALLTAVEDVRWLITALGLLAVNIPEAECARAEALAEKALTLAKAVDEPYVIAFAEAEAGLARRMHYGDYDEAWEYLDAALRHARAVGADWLTMYAMLNLASLAQERGQNALSLRLWRRVRPLTEAYGDRYLTFFACHGLGLLAVEAGDVEEGAVAWQQALTLAGELGSEAFELLCVFGVAGLLVARGQPKHSARLLGAGAAAWGDGAPYAYFRRLIETGREPALAATLASLDASAFARAWEAGQALSLEEATTLARAAVLPTPAATDRDCTD